jgi:hypothetical protein
LPAVQSWSRSCLPACDLSVLVSNPGDALHGPMGRSNDDVYCALAIRRDLADVGAEDANATPRLKLVCHAPASVSMLVRDMSAEPTQTVSGMPNQLPQAPPPRTRPSSLGRAAHRRRGRFQARRRPLSPGNDSACAAVRAPTDRPPRVVSRKPGLAYSADSTGSKRVHRSNLDLQHRTKLRACAGSA